MASLGWNTESTLLPKKAKKIAAPNTSMGALKDEVFAASMTAAAAGGHLHQRCFAIGKLGAQTRIERGVALLDDTVELAVGDELGGSPQAARVAVHPVNVADEQVLDLGRLAADLRVEV